jgi:transcriptional regulator of nitric oxide reductase
VTRKVFKNSEVEAAFKVTLVEGLDDQARRAPDAPFVELYFAHLNVPSAGRNLLAAQTWDYIQKRLDPGDHALLVMAKGRYGIVSDNFQRSTVPDRLTLNQNRLPLEMRDLDLDTQLNVPDELKDAQWRVFRVISPAGLDPSLPLDLELLVSRSKGQFMPEVVNKSFAFSATLPDGYFEAASSESKTWRLSWTSRWWELLILVAGLGLLAWALATPKWLTASPKRLSRFRTGYCDWHQRHRTVATGRQTETANSLDLPRQISTLPVRVTSSSVLPKSYTSKQMCALSRDWWIA